MLFFSVSRGASPTQSCGACVFVLCGAASFLGRVALIIRCKVFGSDHTVRSFLFLSSNGLFLVRVLLDIRSSILRRQATDSLLLQMSRNTRNWWTQPVLRGRWRPWEFGQDEQAEPNANTKATGKGCDGCAEVKDQGAAEHSNAKTKCEGGSDRGAAEQSAIGNLTRPM